MLMNPGATAWPRASITVRPVHSLRRTDIGDAIAIDHDVADVGLAARAVVDRAAAQHQVVQPGRLRCECRRYRHGQRSMPPAMPDCRSKFITTPKYSVPVVLTNSLPTTATASSPLAWRTSVMLSNN